MQYILPTIAGIIAGLISPFLFSTPAHFAAAPTDQTALATPEKGTLTEVKLKEQTAAIGFDDTNLMTHLRVLGQLHELGGGLFFFNKLPTPPCVADLRGLLWFIASEEGDQIAVCIQTGVKGEYIWHPL